jgi:hypothetical protein
MQSQLGYTTGEYDVQFVNETMYIQSFQGTKVTGSGHGKIEVDV